MTAAVALVESPTAEVADLPALAEQINEAHRGVMRASREAVLHALRAGALLIDAKHRVKHGGWLPWLADNFDGSVRTAQLYVWLAQRAEDAQRIAHLGVAGVAAALREQEWAAPLPVVQMAIAEVPAEQAVVLAREGVVVGADRPRLTPAERGFVAGLNVALGGLADVQRGEWDLSAYADELARLRRACVEGRGLPGGESCRRGP